MAAGLLRNEIAVTDSVALILQWHIHELLAHDIHATGL